MKLLHIAIRVVLFAIALAGANVSAQDIAPSFDCTAATPGSIEKLICNDPQLSALDREMARIYQAASATAKGAAKDYLRDDQRYWLTRREKYLGAEVPANCATNLYMERVLFLRTGEGDTNIGGDDGITSGPFAYACENNYAFAITFFETDPPLAYLREDERGYRMDLAPSGSGARYQGLKAAFWGKGNQALVSVAGGPETRCTLSQD